MQRCIKVHTAKLCPHELKEFGFARYLRSNRYVKLTVQPCIKARKAQLCSHKWKRIGFAVRRDQTGMMSRMKESYRKGVVTHPEPESCTVRREAGGEA